MNSKVKHTCDSGDPYTSLIEDLDSNSVIASCVMSPSKSVLIYISFETGISKGKVAIIDNKRVLGAIANLRSTNNFNFSRIALNWYRGTSFE
jgi:hypothetical protein